MKRWQVKPFTFFLLCLSLLFLFTAPKLLPHKLRYNKADEIFDVEKSQWTGVITLWDIPYVESGKGNPVNWLGKYIRSFEKKYPGVFIDVRSLTTERLAMYLYGAEYQDFLPDIISLGVYDQPIPHDLLVDLLPVFTEEELTGFRDIALRRVMDKDKMIGVPWMMGSYGLAVNNYIFSDLDNTEIPEILDIEILDELVRKSSFQKKSGRRVTDYYGFCSYSDSSRPLLSIIYEEDGNIVDNTFYSLLEGWRQENGILPPNLPNLSYKKALQLFAVEKRAAMMLGSSRMIYDNRNLQLAGKGTEFQIYPIPVQSGRLYQDQIAAYGILKQESAEKAKLCVLFLKGLLEEDVQRQLTELGMFSVMNTFRLYMDDPEMNILEESLEQISTGPYGNERDRINALWIDFVSRYTSE